MKTMVPNRPIVGCIFLGWMFVVCIGGQSGCKRKVSSPRGLSKSFSSSRRDPTELLMEGIASTLDHLAEEIDEQLQPPTVVMDASRSSDRKEVRAICSVNPLVPDGPVNRIMVPAGNARAGATTGPRTSPAL